jgi:dimethylargininase
MIVSAVTALVRRPSPRLAEGLITHIKRRSIDLGLARRQWDRYVDVLRGVGWDIIEVPPIDECPDSVFIEDTVIVRGGSALIARPGAESRRAETAGTRAVLHDLGYDVVDIDAPATLDGGDVLKIDDHIYVGQGGRSNGAGADALRSGFRDQNVTVVGVPVRKVLHLKSGVTALPDGTVIGYEPLVDEQGAFPKFLAVPEESGAHVIVVDDRRVVMADDAPKTADMLRGLGFIPITVGISEFQKLEGCVTCLSVRLRNLPARARSAQG